MSIIVTVKTELTEENKELVLKAIERIVVLYNYPSQIKDIITLEKSLRGIYSFNIDSDNFFIKSAKDAKLLLNRLKEQCLKLQQEESYLKIIEKAKAKGLVFEKEEIDNEGTVILTYEIK